MIPFGNQTVTLLKRVEKQENGRTKVAHTAHVLTGCSWQRTAGWPQYDTEQRRTESVVCRIPSGNIAPAPGDYLFLGNIKADRDPAALMDAYRATGAVRITSVNDRTAPGTPLPHYVARGD